MNYTSWNADRSKSAAPVSVRQWRWRWWRWGWCRTHCVCSASRTGWLHDILSLYSFILPFKFLPSRAEKRNSFSDFNSVLPKGPTWPLNIEIWKQWTPTQRGNWKTASSPQLRGKISGFKDTMKQKNIEPTFVSMKALMNEWMKLGSNWLIKHCNHFIFNTYTLYFEILVITTRVLLASLHTALMSTTHFHLYH